MVISTQFRAEKYRFIELFVFILVGMQTQIVWIAFGPAIQQAADYYNVSQTYIVILAALFMAAYIPVNYFASKMIDDQGLKKGVGIGVYLTGIGGLIKALAGPQYWICFFGQLLAAIGQPFVLNCWTKLATNWFLESEKTTAAGLGSISQFFGVIIAMLFPIHTLGIASTLWVYAILGIVFMAIYQIFARDHPKAPPNEYAVKKVKMNYTHGMKEILIHNRDFQLLFFILFIGLGVFNALTSEIDLIFESFTYPNTTSGDIGAAILIGGVVGAIVISTISDKYRKRKMFLVGAFMLGVPTTLGLIFFRNADVLYVTSFLYGFIMVSCLPVGLTYAAEITYPHPEETSAGLLMTAGQISGILFLFINVSTFLWWMVGMFGAGIILCSLLRDTKWHETQRINKETPLES